MKLTLFSNLIGIATIALVFLVGQTWAQPAANPPVSRRNSPYAPNPKKKTETRTTATDETAKRPDLPDGQIVKVKSENTPESVQAEPPREQPKNEPSTEFASRSVAAKTLEIAKKANAAPPAPTEIYKVGIGDILFIRLLNAPGKESTYFTVLADGSIDYPLAGEMIHVSGSTTEQIEDILKEKIKLYENPQVSVRVREHNSHAYTVLGLVENPGNRQMQREAIPLYVVKAESMAQSKADHVTIKRSGGTTQSFALRDAKTGDILIYPGDVVEFRLDEAAAETDTSRYYFIGGEIMSGGRKAYINGLTLTQAILESGGLKKSNTKKVTIRRKNADGLLVPTQFDLKAIKEGKVADPILLSGDTIEIGN